MFQKVVVFTLIVASFAFFAFVVLLDGHYYRASPRQPDAPSGRIYSHQVKTMKGVAQVYLTRNEMLPSESVFWVCSVLFLTAYFLNKRWRVFRNPAEHTSAKL
jgi:hypothetical protein